MTYPGFTGIIDAYTGFLYDKRFFITVLNPDSLGSNKILTMVGLIDSQSTGKNSRSG